MRELGAIASLDLNVVWKPSPPRPIEPKELPAENDAKLGKEMSALPPVVREGVMVWPGAPAAVRRKIVLPQWSGPDSSKKLEEMVEILVDDRANTHIGGEIVDHRGLARRLRGHFFRSHVTPYE